MEIRPIPEELIDLASELEALGGGDATVASFSCITHLVETMSNPPVLSIKNGNVVVQYQYADVSVFLFLSRTVKFKAQSS